MRVSNVHGLVTFIAGTEEQEDVFPMQGDVNPITRPKRNAQFQNAFTHAFPIAQIPKFSACDAGSNFRCSHPVPKSVNIVRIGLFSILCPEDERLSLHPQSVNYSCRFVKGVETW